MLYLFFILLRGILAVCTVIEKSFSMKGGCGMHIAKVSRSRLLHMKDFGSN